MLWTHGETSSTKTKLSPRVSRCYAEDPGQGVFVINMDWAAFSPGKRAPGCWVVHADIHAVVGPTWCWSCRGGRAGAICCAAKQGCGDESLEISLSNACSHLSPSISPFSFVLPVTTLLSQLEMLDGTSVEIAPFKTLQVRWQFN